MIAKMWKFSPKMVNIIRHHHLGEVSMEKEKDISIVYLSDCICMMMGIALGNDALSYRFHDNIVTELGITPQDISKIMADFTFNMQKVEALLNIIE
ncbi:Putative signal transduction protein (fragment) [Desulfamplus magnetovallimortis]|uniref:Putative signal transduction protein n=1 Tax=Desulfamplus magnetovallimortis TaxID=1246637 RepID=A0A1W1HGL4_9BACT